MVPLILYLNLAFTSFGLVFFQPTWQASLVFFGIGLANSGLALSALH